MDKKETKAAWSYDAKGKLTGAKTLTWINRSPISGTWQIPANVTIIEPPTTKDGYEIYFKNGAWDYVEIKKDDTTNTETELTEEEKKAQELSALDAEYTSSKQELALAYVDAMMIDDTELQADLKASLVELNANYDSQRAELEG